MTQERDDFPSYNPKEVALRYTCENIADFSAAYVENELSEEHRQLFDDHTHSCPQCTAFLASYQHVIEVAGELAQSDSDKPIGVDVQNRLRAALNQRLGISLPFIA